MAITEYEDRIKDIVDDSDHSSFIYDFLSVYDKISKATITKLRKGSNNLSKVPGEVYLKNKLYFKETLGDVLQAYSELEDKIAELKSKPRYVIVTDYTQLLAKDEETGDSLDIKFKELPRYFDFFLAWNGIEKADFERENPADLKAAERFAKIYDELLKGNKDADRHGLNLFLIRLLFCLFSEDTGIFEQDLFTNYLKKFTALDGSDMNKRFKELFNFLDQQDRNGDEPAYLANFPYVNGSLFTEPHLNLNFNTKIRTLIIDAGELIGWQSVNPDILGSMLQAVASEDQRSHLGMHYTSVPNIMKVIKPLFLDELRQDFEEAKGNADKLQRLYERIGQIKFMDPACGSGNFLIITYKELRQLEIDILIELNNMGLATMYVPSVTLDQFYGIEIEDFACDVTRLSLWIAEHQMNVKLHQEIYDAVRPTLPLHKAGAIICGNALRIDWNEVLPHEKDDEVYLFGNPPYLGYSLQSKEQKEDLKNIFKGIRGNGYLDYISGWFEMGTRFIKNTKAKCAFVTTNSINQGVQIPVLWPHLLKDIQIIFAYTSFKWSNSARNNAGVIVSIIGLADKDLVDVQKKLFSGNIYKIVGNISPYLIEGNNAVVVSQSESLFNLPTMLLGSTPRDNGGLIFSFDEYLNAIEKNPEVKRYFKYYIGSRELLNGDKRYTLWLNKEEYKMLAANELISKHINIVRKFRLNSKRNSTRELAKIPYQFSEIRWKPENAVVVPCVTSGNRIYAPIGFVQDDTVIANSANTIYGAELWLMGILMSKMQMIWLRTVGGKLKNDYRYSATMVYNTFPVPELSTRRKNEIEDLVLNILDIRDEEGGTLAELYGSPLAEKNPKPMNPRLLEAHQALDEVVDRAYKPSGFNDDNERLSLLLKMYSEKVKEQGK
ncbi:class I SAM-dependent DNA methyltransferase [Ligilactobacillus ruminis]|uniref:site-specific DNA-methyltransferase (adenine-specific) n=1 Tax=Ligilactobacillus ruminis TaxID=1623 RepID=A0AAQ2XN50_9LACO|nr:DNA methyltransferase [Ligilactobacillus ruminis]WDC81361.1 class I SAM-dependent DNA methyltransferase [Ligilactobacillus ruminis]